MTDPTFSEFAEPDVYTLEIPPEAYEDVTQWTGSGKVEITFTPEQANRFAEYVEKEVGGHER